VGVSEEGRKMTNLKLLPHIPLPFKEMMADMLKVKPPQRSYPNPKRKLGRRHERRTSKEAA